MLETYLHVREDVLQLFGFAETAERELFELLLSVQGVGPKVYWLGKASPRYLETDVLEWLERSVL